MSDLVRRLRAHLLCNDYMDEAADEIERLTAENRHLIAVLDRWLHSAPGFHGTPLQKETSDLVSTLLKPGMMSDELAEDTAKRIVAQSQLSKLHPDCRGPWERGLTSYPVGEHITDCEKCLEWNRHSDRHSDSTRQAQRCSYCDHYAVTGSWKCEICGRQGDDVPVSTLPVPEKQLQDMKNDDCTQFGDEDTQDVGDSTRQEKDND